MTERDLKPCEKCRAPHLNFARDLTGTVRFVFCKVCDHQLPISDWPRRAGDSHE